MVILSLDVVVVVVVYVKSVGNAVVQTINNKFFTEQNVYGVEIVND